MAQRICSSKLKTCTSNLQDFEKINNFILRSTQVNFRSFRNIWNCRKEGSMLCSSVSCLVQIFRHKQLGTSVVLFILQLHLLWLYILYILHFFHPSTENKQMKKKKKKKRSNNNKTVQEFINECFPFLFVCLLLLLFLKHGKHLQCRIKKKSRQETKGNKKR